MITSQRHFKKYSWRTQPPFLRAVLLCCALLFTSLWFSTAAFAAEKSRIELTAEEKAWLAEHPDIALGTPTSFPPFVIKRADGTYEGVLVDYLEAASQILNHRIRPHIEDPWAKVQEKAEKREIDGLAMGGKSPDRAASYHATEPLIKTYFSVFASSQYEHQIQQFSDIDGLRIGYKSGAKPTRTLLEKLPRATLKNYDNNETLTQALLSQEVDVVVAWISYDYFRKNNLQGMIDNILLIYEYPMEMVTHIRKDWPEFVSIMNKVIEIMREDELPTIANKWFLDWPRQETKSSRVHLTPEEKAWLSAHPTITLGASASYPPNTIANTDGTYRGILPDVYEQISQLIGAKVKVQVGKVWSEVQKKAENRELDGLALGGRDPQRDKFYTATDRLYPSFFSVFAPSNNSLKIDSFKDLDGLRIGYKRGARPAKARLETLPAATIIPFDSHESMTQALLSKKIDVIVAWMSYDYWRKNTLQGTIDKIYLIEESPLDLVIYIRKDWPEFVPIMNKAIAALQQDAMPRIIDKWFGDWPKSYVATSVPLTQEERAWLDLKHTIRVRVVDWPPYLIVKENEPPQGIVIDYLKLIEERTGVRFKYEVSDQPFAEFLESMKQGQGPGMTAVITPTPEREEYLSFSENYISSPNVIFIRNQDTPILDINGLFGKTVAVPRGFALQKDLAEGYPEIQQLLVDSDEMALQAVATGRADAYIGNLTVASHIIHKRGLSNLQVTSASPFGEQTLSMGNRKDWPELTSIIDKALLSITEEEKTAINNKYLAVRYETGIKPKVVLKGVLGVIGTAFCIILLFVVWNRTLKNTVDMRTADLEEEITERKMSEKKVVDHQQRLKALASQLILAEEQERRRIASDLHDDVSQKLVLSNLQLEAAIKISDDAAVQEKLEEVSDMLFTTTRETRQLIFELSSSTAGDLGLGAAINEWADNILKKNHDIDFELRDNLAGIDIEQDLRAILFRNVRELLTNTLKYARANTVVVTLDQANGQVMVTVQDNGVGFNHEQVMNNVNLDGGFGIFSIQERMSDFGGTLEIISAPHKGCTMIMSAPCDVNPGRPS